MHDLLIVNGTVVGPGGSDVFRHRRQRQEDHGYGPRGSLGTEAKKVVDAGTCLVIPGGIDPHVHYAMNFEHILATEGPAFSFAAAMGGNTSVIDFVFQEPPQGLNDAIVARKEEFAGNMAIDYSFHAILTKKFSYDVVEEIGQAIKDGIPTIKAMMTYGYMADDGQIWGLMSEVAERGGMSVVHAEDDAIANWLTQKYIREGKTHGAYISEVRGPLSRRRPRAAAMSLPSAQARRCTCSTGRGERDRGAGRVPRSAACVLRPTLSAYMSFTQDDIWDETPITVNGKIYVARGCLYNNYPVPKFKEVRQTIWKAVTGVCRPWRPPRS